MLLFLLILLKKATDLE